MLYTLWKTTTAKKKLNERDDGIFRNKNKTKIILEIRFSLLVCVIRNPVSR